ncbi:MAG: alpha/beta hydrolase [Acidobacteria bacterium]|nr:alpha/beta hydrolase [Acidobacteriota bacterium]
MLKKISLLIGLIACIYLNTDTFVLAGEPTLETAPSKFTKLDGNKIHYKEFGKGKTALVFVHGWTCNLNFWKYQVPAVTKDAHLIAIDLPGHGQSDKPELSIYSMAFFAKAVNAVLTEAKVEHAVLIGHSMGTPVIREYYRLFPKKVTALVVVDGKLRPFFTDQAKIDQFISLFEKPDYTEVMGQMINGMFPNPAQTTLRDEVKAQMLAAPQFVVVGAMKGMLDQSIWKDDKIDVPVLHILSKSPMWTADYEKYVWTIAPKTEYTQMDGVGHFLMMEKPDEFNRILHDFLKKNGVVKK